MVVAVVTPLTHSLEDNILDANRKTHADHLRTEDHTARNRTPDLAANPGSEHDPAVLPSRRLPSGDGVDRQPPAPVREGWALLGRSTKQRVRRRYRHH